MMPLPSTTSPNARNFGLGVLICAGAVLNLTLWVRNLRHPETLNSDFMAFWSFPRFAAIHPIGQIYEAAALQGFQKALYPDFGSFYPYLYPPTFLLPSWWLKFFAYGPALLAWTLAGLILFTAGALAFFGRKNWVVWLAMLASPAALINGMTGETAFFTSGLILLGFAALPRRPVLAGIAFGLLTLKPQLGVLVPFFLLARRDWMAMISAAVTGVGLILLSCLVFPPGLWLDWAHSLPVYQAQYFSAAGLNLNIIITPAANILALGASGRLAGAVQLVCFLAIAALVYLTARRPGYQLAVAALLAGSFIAVPHAYAYDSITLTAAMALCLRGNTPFWQVILGVLIFLAPLMLLTPWAHAFLYALPEALVFSCIILLALATPEGAISGHEPKHLSPFQP
jgi:hypothetical protein